MPSHSSQRTSQKSGTSGEIPDKLYFRIGDVARLCGVEAYVLRFWESEFPQLRPNKSGTGQRLYRKRDVELALRIKQLLYEDGYTIPGARQVFQAENRRPKSAQPELPGMAAKLAEARLQKMRSDLRELLSLLSAPAAQAEQGRDHGTSSAARPRRLARIDVPAATLFEE